MYVSEYNEMLCNGQEGPIRNPSLLDDDDYDEYNDHNDDANDDDDDDVIQRQGGSDTKSSKAPCSLIFNQFQYMCFF